MYKNVISSENLRNWLLKCINTHSSAFHSHLHGRSEENCLIAQAVHCTVDSGGYSDAFCLVLFKLVTLFQFPVLFSTKEFGELQWCIYLPAFGTCTMYDDHMQTCLTLQISRQEWGEKLAHKNICWKI